MKAILTGITALFSAATLAAQQQQQAPPAQGGERSGVACTHMNPNPEGHMMPGMTHPGMLPGAMPMSGTPMGMSRGHMMPGMMQGGPGSATPMGDMRMGDMSMMAAPWVDVMHQTMLFAPQRITGQADALNLSDGQKQRIEQLTKDLGAASASTDQAQQQLKVLLAADQPDPAAVRSAAHTAFGGVATLWAEQAAAAAAVRGILTKAQREQIEQHEPCWTGPAPERR